MKKIPSVRFRARVIHGERIGTPFGIATANLDLEKDLSDIKDGVYAVEVFFDHQQYAGVMHIGQRLTFGATKTYEVHIFRFDRDIYEQEIEVQLVGYLRETKKFANADMLYTQIEKDVLQTEKYFVRRNILNVWKTISAAEKEDWAQKVINILVEKDMIPNGATIFGFAPMDDEIPYVPKMCKTFVKNVYTFPRVMAGSMQFYEATYENLTPGMYGILEPGLNAPVRLPKSGDVVMVPGVAGNHSGERLGRGGGFYDRFLSQLPDDVRTILVLPAFAEQKELPLEAHDQKVSDVIFV